jgi:hypothetical protein
MADQDRLGAFSYLRALAPIGGFLLVFGAYRWFHDLAGLDEKKLLAVEGLEWTHWVNLDLEASSDYLQALVSWGTTGMLFVLAWIVGLFVVLCITVLELPPSKSTRFLWLLVVAAIAGVGIGFRDDPLTLPAMFGIFERTFENPQPFLGHFFFCEFNRLAMHAAVALAVAAAVTLCGRPRSAPDLRLQATRLQKILYAGAAILVVGCLHVAAIHNLPLPFLDPDAREAVREAGKGIVAATGLLWTLLLLGIFLPAAAVLRSDALGVADRQGLKPTDPNLRDWLKDQQLDYPLAKQIRHLVAALAPLLAGGPGAVLLDVVTGF